MASPFRGPVAVILAVAPVHWITALTSRSSQLSFPTNSLIFSVLGPTSLAVHEYGREPRLQECQTRVLGEVRCCRWAVSV